VPRLAFRLSSLRSAISLTRTLVIYAPAPSDMDLEGKTEELSGDCSAFCRYSANSQIHPRTSSHSQLAI